MVQLAPSAEPAHAVMMGSFGGRRCVLLVLFTTVVADSRFLWIYQQSGMGFGDKMNFYYNGAAIAKALQRTLVGLVLRSNSTCGAA